MVRYLYYRKGASTTAPSPKGHFFPLLMASSRGNLELCKWLYEHGAEKDIKRTSIRRFLPRTPLKAAYSPHQDPALAHWLILKGAVCSTWLLVKLIARC